MFLFRSLAWNTTVQVLGKVISTLLGLIALGLITRYLGQKGFGEYATVNAFLQFFGILIDFGLVITTLSMISEPKADTSRVFSNLFTLRVISAILFLGSAPLISFFFPYPFHIKAAISILSLSFLFITLNQILIGLFQKNLQMAKVAFSEIAGRIILILMLFIFTKTDAGFFSVLWAIILASFTNFLINFLYSRSFVRISFAFDFSLWKEIFHRAWPIGVSIFFNLFYLQTGIIVLSLLQSAEEVGLYGAAFRVLEVLITLPMMFMGLILPLLVQAWAKKQGYLFQEQMTMAFTFLILGSVPLAVGSFFVASPLMVFIAGSGFAAAGPILIILSLAVSLVFVSSLFTHTVVAINKQKTMLWGFFLAALFSLFGYLLFIPRLGGIGAALATAGAELIVAVFAIVLVVSATKTIPGLKIIPKVLISSALMAVILYFFKEQHVLVSIIAAVIIYSLGLFLTRAIKLQTIKELLRLPM